MIDIHDGADHRALQAADMAFQLRADGRWNLVKNRIGLARAGMTWLEKEQAIGEIRELPRGADYRIYEYAVRAPRKRAN